MSLHHIANHLASKGRNGDTTLVHMTKDEVAGLQALAKAHGTSLTKNPDTGLPEAFGLNSLVPMAAGAGLMAMGVPAPVAAGLVGFGAYAQTGSLQKGLSAGLGAYGGAGLMEGVTYAGQDAIAREAAANAIGTTPEAMLTEQGAQQALTTTPVDPMDFHQANAYFDPTKAQQYSGAYKTAFDTAPRTDIVSRGFSAVMDNPSAYYDRIGGGMGLATKGAAALSPAIADMMTPKQYAPPEIKSDSDMGQRYGYMPGYPSGKQEYVKLTDEQAKSLYGFAEGGSIEQMSSANAIGANTGYPGADISHDAYATPWQTSISKNVIVGSQDVAVDPYTGQEQRLAPAGVARFAEGGISGLRVGSRDVAGNEKVNQPQEPQGYTYDQANQKYSGSAPVGNYLGGGQYEQANNLYGALGILDGSKFGALTPLYAGAMGADMVGYDAAGNPVYAGGYMDPNAYRPDANGVYGPGTIQYKQRSWINNQMAANQSGGYAAGGGISALGGYSDGGRLLKGPGDGMSDNIPAKIGEKQPARLADGEFVVPADVVSHLGNGSTDAGAKQLYKMMDKVRTARTGRKAQGKQINPNKYVPA